MISGVADAEAVHSPASCVGSLWSVPTQWRCDCECICERLFVYACPATDWRPVQDVVCLSTRVRLQHPTPLIPVQEKLGWNEWMDVKSRFLIRKVACLLFSYYTVLFITSCRVITIAFALVLTFLLETIWIRPQRFTLSHNTTIWE